MEQFTSEAVLVEGCLVGNPNGWSYFLEHYHGSLQATIRGLLGEKAADAEMVEEIVARVLYALCADDYRRLCAFDPARAGLRTYLGVVAWAELRQHFREELRWLRGAAARQGRTPAARDAGALSVEVMLAELPDQLTPQRRAFYEGLLLGTAAEPAGEPLSPDNLRQMKKRVLEDVRDYLDGK